MHHECMKHMMYDMHHLYLCILMYHWCIIYDWHASLMHHWCINRMTCDVVTHGWKCRFMAWLAKCGVGGGLGRGDQKVNESLAARNKRYRSSKWSRILSLRCIVAHWAIGPMHCIVSFQPLFGRIPEATASIKRFAACTDRASVPTMPYWRHTATLRNQRLHCSINAPAAMEQHINKETFRSMQRATIIQCDMSIPSGQYKKTHA